MKAHNKTNVMRILEKNNIPYSPLYYDLKGAEFSGVAVANLLNTPVSQSFKTLAARGTKHPFLVFVIPVACELDLKKAAKAAGEKRVELVAVKDLLKVTGYLRGEVSPVGMKKQYPTFFHLRAESFDTIYISAGKKGCFLACDPLLLAHFLGAEFSDIVL